MSEAFAVTPVLPDTALIALALAIALELDDAKDTPSLTVAPTAKLLIVRSPAAKAPDVTVTAAAVLQKLFHQ